MDRRISGALVLVAALVAVLVTAKLNNPTRIDGKAGTETADPAAVPGDCLVTPPADGIYVADDGKVFATGEGGTFLGPRPAVGPCDGSHYGEVFDVIEGSVLNAYSRCLADQAPYRYLGLDPLGTDTWVPTINWSLTLAGPDDLQFINGQRWVACVIAAPDNTAAYDGGLRGVFGAGTLPSAFSWCAAGAGSTMEQTPCALPHSTETFGYYEIVTSTPDERELNEGCRELALAATDRPDLGFDTGLHLSATSYFVADNETQRAEGPLPTGRSGYATCAISTTGTQQLGASLVGLGTAPIPWA